MTGSDELDGIVAREGLIIHGTRGSRLHPAAAESRQLSLSVARLLAWIADDPKGDQYLVDLGLNTPPDRHVTPYADLHVQVYADTGLG